ncbi:MAG: energy transducer TonB [Bacteroidia bacterium]|nr:energy transducer TonB [Bacteroidia bacterium]
METKKTPRADLENKKGLFTEIGLAVALIVCFSVFEWSTTAAEINFTGVSEPVTFEDQMMVPITRMETPTPPPPPAPKPADIITIIDDDEELVDDYDWASSEANEDDAITYTTIEVKPEEEEDDSEVLFITDQMPVFPGGEVALRKYLAESIRYPVMAIESNVQGRVFVSFVVDKTGAVTQVKVARGIDGLLDKEALRVVQSMPKWTPGMQRGKAVNVAYTVPISFVLK